MKKKFLVVVVMVMMVMAIGTGCSSPVTSPIKYESHTTEIKEAVKNPQTGEVEWVNLED